MGVPCRPFQIKDPVKKGYSPRVSQTAPERILIIRPSALGDVCRSVPLLVTLRAAYPHARIDWLVNESFADAVRHHPMLTAVVPFPRSALGFSRLLSSEGRRRLHAFIASLRRPRYDLVIDAQGLGRSGLFAHWTRAPRRVGFANAREFGWLGLTARHAIDPALHTVDRMLELLRREHLEPVHDMRLYASNDDRAGIDQTLRGARYLVVAPTSRWAGKRWPAERFAETTRRLLDAGHAEYAVVVASASERDQCAALLSSRHPRILDQVGRTTVGELMALIERSALVLANDSAALHMAVGFDRPMVGLFGPTRTDLVGPYRRDKDAIRAAAAPTANLHKNEAAGRAMMEAIPVETVFRACADRLDAARPSTHTTTITP